MENIATDNDLNIDRELFREACEKIVAQERSRGGIGTLGEKTIHAVVKHYMVPREEYHEVRCGKYVADILFEGEITEIQTANFNVLRRKLEAFLEEYEVTVVYPIPAVKWLIWMDEETGEISTKRKSPRRGSYYDVFRELYKIRSFLDHSRLHFKLLLLDVEEYRLLNGWSHDRKKGSSRFDRIPVDIRGELMLCEPQDYRYFVPDLLQTPYTSADFAKYAGISKDLARTVLQILSDLSIVRRIGKKGNNILYE